MRTLADRLSSKVRFASDLSPNGTPGCLVWTGGLNCPGGYGQVRLPGNQRVPAHLAALALAGIPVPAGTEPDHLCRRRTCINIKHLEFVPHAVNVRRGDSAKLTDEEAEEVKYLFSAGWNRPAIADAYGVTRQYLYLLDTGQRRV